MILDGAGTLHILFADWEAISTDRDGNGVPDDCDTPPKFSRGDADQNGRLDVTDSIFILEYLFRGGRTPVCMKAADADDDGRVRLTDAVAIFLTESGLRETLPAPFPGCGLDSSGDSLTCAAFASCE